MKQPKKLTREQKECLSAHYLNCKDWMLVEETDFYYRIINKNTGVIKSVDKFRRVRRRSKMNNDILIIIHRDKCKDVLEAMYDLINYLPDIRKNMYVDKHRAVIDICNHIRVSFRCGDVYKMAGIRPNYYETWSLEADEFLAQSAAKCCGKKLDSLQDIARVIQEEIKEKEFNDQN